MPYIIKIWKSKIAFFVIFIILSQGLKIDQKKANNSLTDISGERSQLSQKPKKERHDYYNLQETNRISESRSIKYLNQCKDLCLQIHRLFPFEFKYHRLIYRQEQGEMKYVTGQCLYAFRTNGLETSKKASNQRKQQRKWYGWDRLKQYIDLSTVQDQECIQQRKAWFSYQKDCQDQSLRLTEGSRIDFKFTIVHSNFQYYQNQGFQNLQPFDDMDKLFSQLPQIR